jgi:plasmid stabilization system protein ParE
VSGYILSADADIDLDEIWEYVAADNIEAADRWIGKLFDSFEAVDAFAIERMEMHLRGRRQICDCPTCT